MEISQIKPEDKQMWNELSQGSSESSRSSWNHTEVQNKDGELSVGRDKPCRICDKKREKLTSFKGKLICYICLEGLRGL